MTARLLSLRVGNRRDILLVRHRTRQLASLLGYSPDEQALLAAAAFELGRRAREATGRARVYFEVTADQFVVWPEVEENDKKFDCAAAPGPLLRLERPLPESRPELGTCDLPGIVRQLMQLTPLDVCKEVERQNLELLRLTAQRLLEEHAPADAEKTEHSA